MTPGQLATTLSALGHEGRLSVLILLTCAGPEGLAAGDIARQTQSLAGTLSTKLKILQQAGLITARRRGRHIHYAAAAEALDILATRLAELATIARREADRPRDRDLARTTG